MAEFNNHVTKTLEKLTAFISWYEPDLGDSCRRPPPWATQTRTFPGASADTCIRLAGRAVSLATSNGKRGWEMEYLAFGLYRQGKQGWTEMEMHMERVSLECLLQFCSRTFSMMYLYMFIYTHTDVYIYREPKMGLHFKHTVL